MEEQLQKAMRGDSKAMLALYDELKTKVIFLCQSLLLETTEAEQSVSAAFKQLWEELLAGRINSTEELERFAVRRAVMYCKAKVAKQRSRAFRIPIGTNFANHPYKVETMNFEGDSHVIILKNLPDFQRFIYVLYVVAEYTEEEIARIFNTTATVIRKALDAEQSNIDRMTAVIGKEMDVTVSITADDFHYWLLKKAETATLLPDTEAAQRKSIETLCAPIQKREKKKRTTILSIIVLVLLALCAVVALTTRDDTDETIDLDNAKPTPELAADTDSEEVDDAENLDETTLAALGAATHYAEITIADYGTITVALNGNAAPETVQNFVSLANDGFYDGLTFHRIIEGFMMQGGDPNGDGTGGAEQTITGEFADNGFENNLSHTRGAISMARSNDYNSASSQFFIVHEDSISLDGQYAVFGYVTDGMDIVDEICTAAEPTDNNGSIAAEEQPIITSVIVSLVLTETEESAESEAASAEETASDAEPAA